MAEESSEHTEHKTDTELTIDPWSPRTGSHTEMTKNTHSHTTDADSYPRNGPTSPAAMCCRKLDWKTETFHPSGNSAELSLLRPQQQRSKKYQVYPEAQAKLYCRSTWVLEECRCSRRNSGLHWWSTRMSWPYEVNKLTVKQMQSDISIYLEPCLCIACRVPG